MQLKSQDISNLTQKRTKQLYLVHGGDPLLTLESVQSIKASLNTLGYTSNEILDSIYGEKIWEELLTSLDNLDLFASHKIIELRLANVKFGRDGGKVLFNFINNLPKNISLIVVAEKLNSKELNSKWATEIKNNGNIINASAVTKYNLTTWIKNRIKAENILMSESSINLLAQHFEGNLLALSQAITKIKIYFDQENNNEVHISDVELKQFITVATKFNIFDFTNSLINNDAKRAFQILQILRQEKSEPALIIWAITREVKNLEKIQHNIQTYNTPIDLACKKLGIWQSQISSFRNTLNRANKGFFIKILDQLIVLDSISKNLINGNFWDYLQSFCLTFLNLNSLNLEEARL